MSRRSASAARKRAHGTCRHRRRQRGKRRGWVRPFVRACDALKATRRLIRLTLRAAAVAERCAHRRPVQASRGLWKASGMLVVASERLVKAATQLAEVLAFMAREPQNSRYAPELTAMAIERWTEASTLLDETSREVFALHTGLLARLETGELVPEPSGRRPRIVLAPRPVPIRAFLSAREPRAADRISPLLRRRRRTPRPAALRVPRRSVLGRAPPVFSLCSL